MTIERFQVVCVGGGPAGISLAIECVEMGMAPEKILILEKGECSIKAIRQFYPDKKMTIANYKNLPTQTHGHLPCFPDLTKVQTIEYFDELIARYKLQYRLNSEVSKVSSFEGGFQVRVNQDDVCCDFVGVGIGILGRPNKPSYKIPPKLRNEVLFDLTSQPVKNCKVAVVGGGDTSSEYCQILVEDACDVTLIHRQESITKMMDSNLRAVEELVKLGKLHLYRSCMIKEIQDDNGRPKIVYENSESFSDEIFDKVIFAIGGTTPVNFLKSMGVEFTDSNWPKLNEFGETNISNLFLLGDLVAGKTGGSIITAYNASYRSAQKIMERL